MSRAVEADQWLSEVSLATVFAMLRDSGANEVLYKVLPKNANSKNQVYMAPDMSQLGKIPSGEVTLHVSTSKKGDGVKAVFRAALDFFWLGKDGVACPAPQAKLIFYPQYPEVRFSGFLQGCSSPPSTLYDKAQRGQDPGRILVLGIGNGRKVFAITLPPESPAARELLADLPGDSYGVFRVLSLNSIEQGDSFRELMRRLCGIHRSEWVASRRLDKNGASVPCRATNCHGNTLEALLGIRSNGYAQPDFEGWEVKARKVPNAEKAGATVVTMFTPEPTAGAYRDLQFEDFMRRYAYPDTQGRADRLNFGGTYRVDKMAYARTGVRMVLEGYDAVTKKYSPAGAVRLLDGKENDVMVWSFVKLMDHWKEKHAHAAFVPAQLRLNPDYEYRFGRQILIGEGAEFGLLLNAFQQGWIYYDPGIKLEGVSTTKPTQKKRSQFRIKSQNIADLYVSSRVVDVCDPAGA